MDDGILRIHQWRAEYRLPRQDPNLAQRLDHVLHKTLPEALKSSMAPLGKDSEEIWLLRRLVFDLDLDLGLSDEEIARCWANRFTQILAKTLAQTNRKEVVYFPDRSAYLARFLVDLAGGAAWSAWYFREFEGLKALPVSMALRTAVLEDPALGQEALLRLDRADRARVLSALTDGEAQRIVTCLAQQVGARTVPGQRDIEQIRVALAARDDLNLTFGAAVLYLYLRVAAARPQAAGWPLAQICIAVIELRNILETMEQPRAVISAVAGERMAALHRLVGHVLAERLQGLFGLPVPLRNQLLGDLFQAEAAAQEALPLGEEPRFTPFGGAFLLLPLLMAMPLEEAVAPWPQPEETEKVAGVRLMLLAQCLGGKQAFYVFRDPLLRELAGVAPGFTAATARQWLNSITVDWQYHCFRVLAAWRLAYLGQSTVQVTHLSHDRRRVAVAYAPGHGTWVFLRGCRPRRMQSFTSALRRVLPEAVHIDMHTSTNNQNLHQDLDYLRLPAALRPRYALEDLLRCLAQGVLRDFASRLPGFAGSSLPYLFRNFLSIQAHVTPEAKRHLVRLDRSPLNVILSMTGLTRRQYRLPWWDERPLVLYQEG